MSSCIDILARATARLRGSIVPVRTTSSIARDDRSVFGFAPIKLVSEEIVQAIAFGDLGSAPEVVTRWNPLSRDATALERFAAALDGFLQESLDQGRLPRLWIPHRGALVLLELLGHRYHSNMRASEELRRMGGQCRVLASEAELPGQQTIVIAAELLLEHAVTGQSPAEDRHLGALLTWFEADGQVDPAEEAEREALEPAAAMLPRAIDDRVEAQRRVAKRGGTLGALARRQVERLLNEGALREWGLLIRARSAFLGLGLPPVPGVSRLVDASNERLRWALRTLPRTPSRPKSLAGLLEEHEYYAAVEEHIGLQGDARTREIVRRSGRSILATVVAIDQPLPNRHPCVLTLGADQPIVRVRPGAGLQNLDGSVAGRVEDVGPGDGEQRILIDLRLIKGVRRRSLPLVGSRIEWIDDLPFDARFPRREAYRAAQLAGSFTLSLDPLPEARPRILPPGDLERVAENLRRR